MKKPNHSTSLLVVRTYWHHVWRYPRHVIALLINIPLTILVYQYLPPLIAAVVLNRLSQHDFQPHHLWASFGGDVVLYAVFTIVGGSILYRITDILAWRLEAHVEQDLAQRVFAHLLSQSADFHANTFGGSLVSQTNKVMSSYIRLADTTIFQVLPLLSGLVWATIILTLRQASLFAGLLLLFAVVYMTSAIFISRSVRTKGAIQAAAESAQTGNLADAITNVMAIKSFAGSSFEKRRFGKTTARTYDATLDLMRTSQRTLIYFASINSLISSLSLLMAVVGVMVFNANLASVFLILSYTGSIVNQLFTFSTNSLRNYNRSLGDAADMAKILAETPSVLDPAAPEKIRIKHGAINFEGVHFTHAGSEDALFADFSLAIKPGEKIGLVGRSGSGKSTFTRLLLRFSDIQKGAITIDGQNIAHITQDDLHSKIAYVPQEPLLFHRTIAENIAYGRPDATSETIRQVARFSHAAEFIDILPKGYETLVGERGVKLSGGQRQRVAIARAMLKDAPVLVLDEATSSLDSESEVLIQDALWKLMEGRTAIVIAHRLSTIQKMDRIIVMDEGKIVEQGTHKDLLKANGTYAKLWAHQSGGFLED